MPPPSADEMAPTSDLPLRPKTSPSLTNFTLFSDLPSELRCKIWSLSLTPRLIEVQFRKDREQKWHGYRSAMPSLLHTCIESRLEALRSYKLAFQHPFATNSCYFNFSIDTLYISGVSYHEQRQGFITHSAIRDDIEHVERLALRPSSFATATTPRWNAVPPLFYFSNLKELKMTASMNHEENCTACIRDEIGMVDLSHIDLETSEWGDEFRFPGADVEDFKEGLKESLEEGQWYDGVQEVRGWKVPRFVRKGVCRRGEREHEPRWLDWDVDPFLWGAGVV